MLARGRQFYAVAIRTRGPHKTHLRQMDKRFCLFFALLSIFVVGILKIFGVLHQGIQTIISLLEVVSTRENGHARRRHVRGEGAPTRKAPKIVSCPLSNYLAALTWSVKSFDRKRLTSDKQSVPPKSVVHFIVGLNISVIKINWVISLLSDGVINWWLTHSFKSFLTTGTINRK